MEPANQTSNSSISLAEKVDILKSVSIFFDTPPDTLAEVAELLEEVNVPAGFTIFEQGDMGASMYIVVEGSVWIHDGEMTLNYLSAREVFGEMAALDPEPRSASATTVEDTLLFRLEEQSLHALISRSPDVGAAGKEAVGLPTSWRVAGSKKRSGSRKCPRGGGHLAS